MNTQPSAGAAGAIQSSLLLQSLPGLVHGFTGALTDQGAAGFAAALRGMLSPHALAPSAPLFVLQQVHSARLISVSARNLEFAQAPARDDPRSGTQDPPPADGLILIDGPAVVAIQSADCVPVLAVSAQRGQVAALHAGWRGVSAGILPSLLQHWLEQGGSPDAIRLVFGPAIRACCYAVREDCTAAFDPAHLRGAIEHRGGRMYLELTRVLTNQAQAAGVPPSAIDTLPQCTSCFGDPASRPFASYRRDGRPGQPFPHRNASYIGFASIGA